MPENMNEDAVPQTATNAPEPVRPVPPMAINSGGAAEIAFRRIARRKLVERGYAEEMIENKITELLHKGLPIDPKVLVE